MMWSSKSNMDAGNLHKRLGVASVAREITLIQYEDGTIERYSRGVRHHDTLPAIEYPDGTKEWYHYGKLISKQDPSQVADEEGKN